MFASFARVYRSHKKTLIALACVGVFSALTTYAMPPSTPYAGGETLDPSCAPGDINCTVSISQWTTVTGGIAYNSGFVGIGTSTPDEAIHIYNADNKGIKLERTDNPRYALIRINPEGGLEFNSAVGVTGLRHDMQVAGVTALGIDASGNVGIKNDNPVYDLDVIGDINFTGNLYRNGVLFGGGGSSLIGSTSTEGSEAWLGEGAGLGASPITTVMVGYEAGISATNARSSVFVGVSAGAGAANAYNSTFIGENAGNNALYATRATFIGRNAGNAVATDPMYDADVNLDDFYFHSVFIGDSAGDSALFANDSVFIGTGSGYSADNAYSSVFSGANAGYNATDASSAVFSGYQAGTGATNASGSVFIGSRAGALAVNAIGSTFVGLGAGKTAINATNSTFLGSAAGWEATNATKSIFIGSNAGYQDAVNNSGNTNDYSILIGPSTSTGGFSNSIALGLGATNTGSNQFMIGSSTRPIDVTRWNGSASTQCTITTGTGIACTSDERLKTNITELPGDTLANLRNVDTVTFNWKNGVGDTQIGFIAQNLEQYFPQLVATDTDGYKSVYYAQMTPILTKAIQELDVQVQDIASLNTEGSFATRVRAWLADAQNGIQKLFAKEIETQTLCVADEAGQKTCLTKAQLDALIQASGEQSVVVPIVETQDPDPQPVVEESESTSEGDAQQL
jgi:hypothetical protein